MELLLAVTYLALCASSILGCVTASAHRIKEVEQREIVMGYVTSQLESLAATTRKPGGTTLSNSISVPIPGVLNTVTISRKVEAVAGHTDLYYIEVNAGWTVSSSGNNRIQYYKTATYVRAPYG